MNGLFNRKEWSSAIFRASTAVELAANYVIRQEFEHKRNLDTDFVNHLLIWANGVQGKFSKLLIPIFKGTKFQKQLKNLNKKVADINKERNSIAHSGQFKKKSTAEKIIKESEIIIHTLINNYDPQFRLNKPVN